MLAKFNDPPYWVTGPQRNTQNPLAKRFVDVDAHDSRVTELWFSDERRKVLQDLKEMNETDFQDLVTTVEKNDSQLLVLYIPTKRALGWIKDGGDPAEMYYEELTKRYGIPFLSLTERFSAAPNTNALYLWPWNGHLSVHGNYLISQLLVQKLQTMSGA